MSREELITAIQQFAQKVEHAPTFREFLADTRISSLEFRRHFNSWLEAAGAAGIEARNMGRIADIEQLLKEWARIARSMGRVPSHDQFIARSRFSRKPYVRFFKTWSLVPAGMRDYIHQEGLADEYSWL